MEVNILKLCGPEAANKGEIALDMRFSWKNENSLDEKGMSTYQINNAVLLETLGNRCGQF